MINECGKTDIWPVLARSLSWGYGASGTHGFGSVLVKDRFHDGGHGQYFDPAFVENYWEPFIRRGNYKGTDFEVKMPPTPWWVSMIEVFPVKFLAICLIMICCIVIYNLYSNCAGQPNSDIQVDFQGPVEVPQVKEGFQKP